MSNLAKQEAGSHMEGLGYHLVQFTHSLCEERASDLVMVKRQSLNPPKT